MSGEVPIQVVVAAFRDEKGADAALDQLRAAQREGLIKIDDAAVLRRDANDKLHIKETADMSGGKGATIGGVTGAVLGVLGGPAVWAAAGIGALVGGLAAKLRDAGFSDTRLKELGQGLKPGTSAIVAVVEHTWVRLVEQELAKEGADVVTEELRKDIATQLEAGRDVAYSALSYAGALDTERAVVGQDYSETSRIVATDQGLYAESVVADKDTITAAAGVVTDQGAAVISGEFKRADVDATGTPPAPGASSGDQPAADPPPGQPPTTAR